MMWRGDTHDAHDTHDIHDTHDTHDIRRVISDKHSDILNTTAPVSALKSQLSHNII